MLGSLSHHFKVTLKTRLSFLQCLTNVPLHGHASQPMGMRHYPYPRPIPHVVTGSATVSSSLPFGVDYQLNSTQIDLG
jgi:hypothetical protein